jgi:hypothetical protein
MVKFHDQSQLEGDDVPAERIRVWLYGDGFASIDGELIAARTGEQRTDSVPAASGGAPAANTPYFSRGKPPPGWSGGHG